MTERKTRSGIPMTEESLREWEKTFEDMDQAILELKAEEDSELSPIQKRNRKYMKLKQQSFPEFET